MIYRVNMYWSAKFLTKTLIAQYSLYRQTDGLSKLYILIGIGNVLKKSRFPILNVADKRTDRHFELLIDPDIEEA